MGKKNKDILKKGMMETKPDFTSSLMDQINTEEEALATVLSEQGVMKSSANFNANLMTQLEGKVPAKVYNPIISKRAWAVIAAACIALTVIVLTTVKQGSYQVPFEFNTEAISNKISSIFKEGSGLLYVGLGVLILSIGLTIEQRFGKKNIPS